MENEHDEEIQVGRKTGVQVPALLDFGRYTGLPVFGGHVFVRRVAKVHRALNNATDWRENRSARCDGLFEVAEIADVALENADLDALSFEIGHERGGIWVVSS